MIEVPDTITTRSPFPQLTVESLDDEIRRLKEERARLADSSPVSEMDLRIVDALLRNRANLREMLLHGRFL